MARHYNKRKIANWTYSAVGVVVALIVIFLVFGHPKEGDEQKSGQSLEGKWVTVEETAVPDAPEPEPLAEVIGVVPESVSQADPEVANLIEQAEALISARPPRIIEARDRLNEILAMPMSAEQQAYVKERLSQLSGKWLFNRRIYPDDKLCGSYRVKRGDLLSKIGKGFNVPYQVLARINRIRRPESLRADEVIKIVKGPFHARVYRSSFTLDLYLQDTFVRSMPVGLGREGMETPTGLWQVKVGSKLVAPTWTNPMTGKTYEANDPDYPLGSRWIALDGIAGEAKDRTGFAIHGTKDPNEIGTASSQGCIRVHNGDAIFLFDLLTPALSRVEVVD